MSAAPSPAKRKREQTIKVNVVPNSARSNSAPVKLEPPAPKTPEVTKPKTAAPRAPLTEVQRRRVMRWIVGIGAAIILGAWLITVRYEVTGGGSGNILTDIIHSFRQLNFGSQKTSPKQEEIQQYQQQVFPQFSNTNS